MANNTSSVDQKELTDREVEAVSRRLYGAGTTLRSIRMLAIEAMDGDPDGLYAIAIQELALSTFRGIDACIRVLGSGPGIGGFETEFHDTDGNNTLHDDTTGATNG